MSLIKKKLHPGKSFLFTKDEKEKIIYFVETPISNLIPLNYHIASQKIIAMNLETLNGISFKAKYKRIVRFLKSNYYTVRKSTHIGQSLPLEAPFKALYFLREVIKKRKLHKYDLSCIINWDETPITFDSPLSYTLAKVGKKTITVKTLGKEKKKLHVFYLLQELEINWKLRLFLKVKKIDLLILN